MKKLSLLLLALASAFMLQAETFVKVTDPATLQDGDQVVLGYADKNHASAGFSSTKKYIDVTTATFTSDAVTLSEPTTITLKKNGTYWNLYIDSKPVGHKSGSNDLDVDRKTTTDFAISIENGNAKIISQTPGKNNNEVFFAYNPSSPRFALYHAGSNMKAISLYRLDETSIPDVVVKEVTIDPAELTLRVGDEATLTATLLPADAVDKTIEWGSTHPEVATVSNGVVTALTKGTAQVWVKATAVGITDTCSVTVLDAMDQTTVTYNAVKDPALLTDGAKVFFGTSKEGEDYIMGFYDVDISKNNIKGVAATYGENRHTVTAEQAYAYTVQRDGDYIIFIDADGNYLRPISDSKLRSSTTLDNQSKWTISSINQDDATVEVKNAGFTSRYIYNNCQGSNEIFNIYSGYDDSYLAKTILYASTAPEWTDRVLDSWMTVSDTLLDWGQYEPDTTYASDVNWKDWGDVRRFTLSFNDLTDDITVTLTGDTAFYCGTEVIRTTAKQPVELSVYWETDEVGVYTGELRLSTATEGVEDIVIQLRAEAVPMGTFPDPNQPVFSLSTKVLTFNLNPDYSDIQMFTFSASNLQKTLYCKWAHTSSVLFKYEYENACMEILAGDYDLELNGSAHFPAGYDYEDEEVYVAVDNLWSVGSYATKLHFYSYEVDSKEELSIDEYVTIRVNVSSVSTDVENIGDAEKGDEARKVIRDGQLLILRNGEAYSVLGNRL
ncbi:MAG: Ig domain-containing protein [Paludibacteraceae bacterium]|nr:Ig domain-containing protein [Paludibacteraceae bacterium]